MFFVAIFTAFLFNVCIAFKESPLVLPIPSPLSINPSVAKRAEGAGPPLMDVFQVSTPINIPSGLSNQCQQVLMSYSFGNSYGKPFSGK
jgi:hypothetical protein